MQNLYSRFRTLLSACALVTFFGAVAQPKVVGYLPTWSNYPNVINSLDLSALTHINIAFSNPNSAGVIYAPAGTDYVVQQAHAKNVKVLLSIAGGEGDGPTYYAVLSNATNTTNFINYLVQTTNGVNGVDGIDVDIEGGIFSAGVTPAMYQNFVTRLATELRARNKLITTAIATSYGSSVTNAAAQQYDFINIMSYDAYGPWSGPGPQSTYQMAVNDVEYWHNKGVAYNKLIVGVPFYGYGWGSYAGSYTYSTIVNTYPGAENSDQIGSGSSMISYNGLTTIRNKTTYAVNNAGGVMIWQLLGDVPTSDSRSLLRAIAAITGNNTPNIAPQVSMSAPANNSGFTAPATVTVSANATDQDGTIASVQFFQGATPIGTDNTAPYSLQWSGVAAGNYVITARATDNRGATTTSAAVNISVTNVPVTQSPYGGTAWSIPGVVETENYDLGGQGVAFNDVTTANQGAAYRTDAVDVEPTSGGGYNIGYVAAGEWLEYTVNISAGTYMIDARVAATEAGKTFRLELDGISLTTIAVPNTASWQTFQTTSVSNLNLTAGTKILRVYAVSGDFNLDRLTFTRVVTNQAPTVSLTSPVSGSTFTAPASITVSANATDADGQINSVVFYNGSTPIGTDNTAPYSIVWNNVAAGSYSVTARATDNAGATATSSARTISVSNTGFTVTIQAENYNMMSGVQTEPNSDAGLGSNVGYIDNGDWMAYYNVSFPASGSYLVEYRVASITGGRLSLDLNAGSIQLGAVNVPATGGWQNWTTVSHIVNVATAGTYNVGVYAQTGGWNINWIRITKTTNARLADDQEFLGSDYKAVNALEISPNPVENFMKIYSPYNLTDGEVKIVNASGIEVYSGQIQDGVLDISELGQGLYTLVFISNDDQQYSQRFMKR